MKAWEREYGKLEGKSHNRNKTHCPQGHPYSGDNLLHVTVNGKERRLCRTCNRNYNKRSTIKRAERRAKLRGLTNYKTEWEKTKKGEKRVKSKSVDKCPNTGIQSQFSDRVPSETK